MKTETNKYTPGPWRENGQTIFDSQGEDICTCGKVVHDEHAANAALIARAPELLEALDVITKFSEGLSNSRCFRNDCTPEQFRYIAEWRNTIEEARAAITKATTL